MKKIIRFSAPAKVILSGEHSVVYGKPALVSAVNKKLTFSLSERPFIKNKTDRVLEKNIQVISKIVLNYLKKMKIKFQKKNYFFKVDSNIPVGRGLGSSAALASASCASFLKFFTGMNFSKPAINQVAYEIEKYFHQNPSGVDNTASCFGGLIYYRKEFEFLKSINPLDFKIPKDFSLFLIDSGRPEETTKQMVELVKKRHKKNFSLIESILCDIERVTKQMVLAIINQDKDLFQSCLLNNEIFLEMLGVVSEKTKRLLNRLSPFGVGKITGAGGRSGNSGFILFFSQNEDKLINFLNREKINFFKLKIDQQGIYENS